jgi:hypothetical protein
MARPQKRWHQLGKGLRLAAPFGGALLMVVGLRLSGIAETLNLLLYDLVTHLRPAPAGASTPITLKSPVALSLIDAPQRLGSSLGRPVILIMPP